MPAGELFVGLAQYGQAVRAQPNPADLRTCYTALFHVEQSRYASGSSTYSTIFRCAPEKGSR